LEELAAQAKCLRCRQSSEPQTMRGFGAQAMGGLVLEPDPPGFVCARQTFL
jgi:hypothetical protein